MNGVTLLLWVGALVLSLCIAIAPLFIWRNTSRMSRMLALIALRVGASPDSVSIVLRGGDTLKDKMCPNCNAVRPVAETRCLLCGHVFSTEEQQAHRADGGRPNGDEA